MAKQLTPRAFTRNLVETIQELAGHADLTMTQRYMHLSPAALDAAIRLLDQPRCERGLGVIERQV
jgi:integrase